MNIDINKDFDREFPDEVWGGFDLRKCLYAGAGLGTSIVSAACLWHFAGMDLVQAVYMMMPVMLLFCALGFAEKQGMTLSMILKEMRYRRKTKHLLYEAAEYNPDQQRKFSMRRTFPKIRPRARKGYRQEQKGERQKKKAEKKRVKKMQGRNIAGKKTAGSGTMKQNRRKKGEGGKSHAGL